MSHKQRIEGWRLVNQMAMRAWHRWSQTMEREDYAHFKILCEVMQDCLEDI